MIEIDDNIFMKAEDIFPDIKLKWYDKIKWYREFQKWRINRRYRKFVDKNGYGIEELIQKNRNEITDNNWTVNVGGMFKIK